MHNAFICIEDYMVHIPYNIVSQLTVSQQPRSVKMNARNMDTRACVC